jgi:uncharacterized membrane protein YbhN (UPF0104 family)
VDALVYLALLLWSAVAAVYLLILVNGGPEKAPESWSLGMQIVGGLFQSLSIALLAFELGVRRARTNGQPMRFAPVIGRGFVLAAPWVVGALVLWVLSAPVLGYLPSFAYELIVAPLVAVLGLPVMIKIGARWRTRPSARTSSPAP